MVDGFPRVTAKYPEIQRDVIEIPYMDTLRFRVATIFDTEVYLNQYEISRHQIRDLDNRPDNINSHELIEKMLIEQLESNIEKIKLDRVTHMVQQITNINLN